MRMANRWWVLVVLAGLSSSSGGIAGAAPEESAVTPWWQRITLGGELRLRGEGLAHFAPFTPIRSAVSRDAFVLLRARPHLDARPTEGLRIFLQPQYARTFAQEESTIANAAAIDDFDLHQAFIEFPRIGGGPVTITTGRQELRYGEERLIGAFGWSNVGRNFDALKARVGWERFWLDAFAAWVQRVGGNQYFGGLYSQWKLAAWGAVEPFALMLHDNDGAAGGGKLTVYTIGGRLFGTAGGWDYGGDGAVQLGRSAGNAILAYAAHAHGGRTFAAAWKPRVGLEYNFASGDGAPAAGKVTTFNNLFPTNHDKYGLMDLVGWRNIHDLAGSFRIEPAKGVKCGFDYHAFFLPEPAGGLFAASGVQIRAGGGGVRRFVGHEVDATVSYAWGHHADFLLGYSLFRGGGFLADTGATGTAHFGYVQTTARF